jgi:hypothetical protein
LEHFPATSIGRNITTDEIWLFGTTALTLKAFPVQWRIEAHREEHGWIELASLGVTGEHELEEVR